MGELLVALLLLVWVSQEAELHKYFEERGACSDLFSLSSFDF